MNADLSYVGDSTARAGFGDLRAPPDPADLLECWSNGVMDGYKADLFHHYSNTPALHYSIKGVCPRESRGIESSRNE